jgi:hypothetical protein
MPFGWPGLDVWIGEGRKRWERRKGKGSLVYWTGITMSFMTKIDILSISSG